MLLCGGGDHTIETKIASVEDTLIEKISQRPNSSPTFAQQYQYSWLLSKIRCRRNRKGRTIPDIFILPFTSFLVFAKKLGRSKGSQHINNVEISSSNGMPIHPAADFGVDPAAF